MIKLTLPKKPEELTEVEEKRLTDEFKKDTSKSVWKQDYIEKSLLEMTNGKCAYSEQKLNSRSSYMEIEHFRHKNLYKDDVVKWGNLLPACKKCNTAKGEWDVEEKPIVNPLVDTPKNHLFVRGFRFYKRDDKGENTIKAVALNDRKHFVNPRGEMAIRIVDEIEETYKHLKTLVSGYHRRHTGGTHKIAYGRMRPGKRVFGCDIHSSALRMAHISGDGDLSSGVVAVGCRI